MHLVFPNVKNADSAVIIFGDEVVVIDAASGPQGIRVGNLLKQLGYCSGDHGTLSLEVTAEYAQNSHNENRRGKHPDSVNRIRHV